MHGRFTRRTVCLLMASLAGCGVAEPDPDDLVATVRGTVFFGGVPATAGQASVRLFHSEVGNPLSANTDANGRYEISNGTVDFLCDSGSSLTAFVGTSPYPYESLPERVTLTPPDLCVGDIDGPDFHLPADPPELLALEVDGTITANGQPISAIVTMTVQSRFWGPHTAAVDTTGADGRYLLEAELPLHYCDNAVIRTSPAAPASVSAAGCFAQTIDIEIGG